MRKLKLPKKSFGSFCSHFNSWHLTSISFDHETEEQARKMENIETKILNHIGIEDPYINL